MLDEMPRHAALPVIHIIWSGTPADGLTAVHIGQLLASGQKRLDWATLRRIDRAPYIGSASADQSANTIPTYLNQPEPSLGIEPLRGLQSNEA